MPRGHRLAAPMLAHPHRVAGYPKYTDGSFPLLVIFDDFLHNRWSHQNLQFAHHGLSWSPVPFEQDKAMDVGRLRGGQRVPCGKSIRATFRQSASMLTLRASMSMAVANATVPLLLSLAFTHTLASTGPPCDSTPTRGWCNSTACVSLRRHGTRLADTVFVPLCGTRQGPKVSTVFLPGEEHGRRWQQMEVPLERFDGPYARRRTELDELVVVPGGEMLEMDAGGELEGGEGGEPGRRRQRQQRRARYVARGLLPLEPPLVVHLDEVLLSAARPLLAGDYPPAYGRTDMNEVQSGWLHAAPSTGKPSKPSKHKCVCECMRPQAWLQNPVCIQAATICLFVSGTCAST